VGEPCFWVVNVTQEERGELYVCIPCMHFISPQLLIIPVGNYFRGVEGVHNDKDD
jgi:hypothetical protein